MRKASVSRKLHLASLQGCSDLQYRLLMCCSNAFSETDLRLYQDTVQSSEAPGQSKGAIKSEAVLPQWPEPDSPREAAADAAAYHGVIARPKTGLFDAVVKSRKKVWSPTLSHPTIHINI